jgi:glycosyltransferase involved in cell wall biosynthesis
MKVSILIPSINGYNLLVTCIESIFENSTGSNDIEVLIKLDFGDEIISKLNDLPYWQNLKIIISERGLGYGEIHNFINDMAKLANGDWLQPLNDDTIMKTKNWDKYLENYDPQKPWILRHQPCEGRVGDIGDYYFPYISRKYYETVGRITGCPSYDGYLLMIANELGIWERVPITILHRDLHEIKQVPEKNDNMIKSMSQRDRMVEKEIDKGKIKSIL